MIFFLSIFALPTKGNKFGQATKYLPSYTSTKEIIPFAVLLFLSCNGAVLQLE
jgi:hypothetical protein